MVSLWAIAGCATLPACPAKGGPIWREATTAHFRLRSDLDEDDARETIRRLEEIATKATQFDGRRWDALALRIEALANLGRCGDAGNLAGVLQSFAPTEVADAVTRSWDALRQSCREASGDGRSVDGK